jgi:hypothetical protein
MLCVYIVACRNGNIYNIYSYCQNDTVFVGLVITAINARFGLVRLQSGHPRPF